MYKYIMVYQVKGFTIVKEYSSYSGAIPVSLFWPLVSHMNQSLSCGYIIYTTYYIRYTYKYIKTIPYFTIVPQAPMGSESITHKAEGRMAYWLRSHEGNRNNCFSKIQLVGQKIPGQNIFH